MTEQVGVRTRWFHQSEISAMGWWRRATCFRPVSNRGPFACKANVITTTLRNRDNLQYLTLYS